MVKELVLPLAVVGILASMLVPVPPMLMDFLIVGNLILALVLFLSTLHIPDTLRLSSLPSMLLLATLYRLALNISTTRNILSSGDGGKVVEAFGSVVIQGNLVVGIVVFLIITLVQFIVIAKGSERVAEVSARFTLDALPGKQMSIDADVRAGLLDFSAARGKRQDLQTESRFYGALDGAMKFIKGDAIAGIVITAINIVGGLAIGIVGEGLEFSQALAKYTTLTIGDGLVAQIPALLNSLAAGIVVTRVARGDEASLAGELLSQLGQVRKVKVITGLTCLVMAAVPGMPALPFLALAVVLLVSAYVTPDAGAPTALQGDQPFTPKPLPLVHIAVDPQGAVLLHRTPGLISAMERVREGVYQRYGVLLPFPEFSVDNGLKSAFQISMRGVPTRAMEYAGDGSRLVQLIEEGYRDLLCVRLVECVDDVMTRKLLDLFEPAAPELIAAIIPTVVSVTQLTEILKSLLGEGITIRSFEVILQSVAESGPTSGGERNLLQEVRVALRRTICHAFAASGELSVITVDPVIDIGLARAEKERSLVDLAHIDQIAQLILQIEAPCVVLVSKSARRILREFLELKGISRVVLAHEEIVSEVKLKALGHVALPCNAHLEAVEARAAA